MTYGAIGRSLLCLLVGVALLASVVALVPGPLQVVAVLIVLPVESLLLAVATSPRRRSTENTSPAAL
ncbi:MAG TPA: hypothetical protein VH482_19090 [Thermomicrobiales bacterium]|jgi:hypothetical protein